MKKTLLIAMLFVSMTANAQRSVPVKAWEVEARVGGTYPFSVYGDEARICPALGVEVRYNPPDSHWSFGTKLDVITTGRDMEMETETTELGFRTISLSALADYNLGQGKNVNPFFGLGLGIGSLDYSIDDSYMDDSKLAAVVTPRIGVELFRHLRLTATATITRNDYSNIGISVGYVFGGGKK